MLEVIHPDLVHPERGEPGYTGDLGSAMGAIFSEGVHVLSSNGVLGDPRQANPEHGQRYWDKVLSVALAEIG